MYMLCICIHIYIYIYLYSYALSYFIYDIQRRSPLKAPASEAARARSAAAATWFRAAYSSPDL